MLDRSNMHSYQRFAASELYERPRVQGIVPMGGGKTCAALTAFLDLLNEGVVRRALVLAPKRVAQLVWTKEPAKWSHLCHLRTSLGLGTAAKRRKMLLWDEPQITLQTIDNTQWLVKELSKLPDDHPLYDLLIIDESSRYKNPRSKRGLALYDIIHKFKNVWLLTGTPRPNGIEDQFLPIKLLSNGTAWGRSFDAWQQRNFTTNPFSPHKWEVIPEREGGFNDTCAAWSFTIDDSEMPELPDITIQEHFDDMIEPALEKYKQMEEELMAELDELGEEVVAAQAAVRTSKLEQISQGFLYRDKTMRGIDPDNGLYERFDNDKLDYVDDLVQGAGGPCIIAYWYKAELDELMRRYPKADRIGAGVSDKKVQEAEHKWNSGGSSMLLLHPASGGHGLNLQNGGNRMIWTMPIWSAELWDQTLKRIHRQGQKRRTYIDIVGVSSGTTLEVDRGKIDRVVNKMSAQDAFIKMVRARNVR